jgi:hypothetical protein
LTLAGGGFVEGSTAERLCQNTTFDIEERRPQLRSSPADCTSGASASHGRNAFNRQGQLDISFSLSDSLQHPNTPIPSSSSAESER